MSDTFVFGTAEYQLILDGPQLLAPVPRAPLVGEWVHLPYGGNVWVTDGARTHLTWQPRIQLQTPDDYFRLLALEGRVAELTTPFGTIATALLRDMSGLQYRPGLNTWEGVVVFEWGG